MSSAFTDNAPLVSIITPCYNGESFLDRYFESVLLQTYPNIELIFINDGSTDKTEEIALSYKSAIEQKGYSFHYIYQKNNGQAAAINKGLKIFTGEFLTWPDSDDIMYPDCIKEKVQFLLNNPAKSMVLSKTDVVSENDLNTITETMFRRSVNKEDVFDDLVFSNDIYYAPIGYMVKSSALLSALPNKQIYVGRGGQNWQLLLPVAYNKKSGFIDKSLGKYVVRAESHSHLENDSAEKQIMRLYGYRDVLIESLPIGMPENEKKQYISKIETNFSTRIFNIANSSGNKKIVKKEYNRLKSLGKADPGIKRAYLELNHKYGFYLMLLFKNPKELICMLKSKFSA